MQKQLGLVLALACLSSVQAAPLNVQREAGGARVRVTSTRPNVVSVVYTQKGVSSKMELRDHEGELSAEQVRLQPAPDQHANPVVVLDYMVDSRDTRHTPVFLELQGGRLHELPRVPLADAASAKQNGATPTRKPPLRFSRATQLLDVQDDIAAPLRAGTTRVRDYLVEFPDRSHAVVETRQLLKGSNLESPEPVKPDPEPKLLGIPLQIWLTISGGRLLVPVVAP